MEFLFISGLSQSVSIFLLICFLAVCVFEFINGFHDTANAVATAIYTKALKPIHAVIWSGIWNFIGVFVGGIAVAMGIMKLVPINDLMSQPIYENISFILAVLIAAIAWNLGTWYFGIPCSSSHTLIGSLLGAGFAFYKMNGGAGPNWDKAKDIGISLLVSPLFGFSLAILVMFIIRYFFKNHKTLFKEPHKKDLPPFGIRATLILTCTLVSFFHGSNDGQKGVGLLLVTMLCFLPAQFAFNDKVTFADTSAGLRRIESTLLSIDSTDAHYQVSLGFATQARELAAKIDAADRKDTKQLVDVRKSLQKFVKGIEGAIKSSVLAPAQEKPIKSEISSLKKAYEFAPLWMLATIAICLGLGTMVGWKRIVVTIGEKIGKSHLSYAQGASAELCAAATIGASTYFGLPVSTTHVLSSGVAGSMVASGGVKNLQKKTITNIAIAWLLTLPVTVLLSASLYFLLRMFLV